MIQILHSTRMTATRSTRKSDNPIHRCKRRSARDPFRRRQRHGYEAAASDHPDGGAYAELLARGGCQRHSCLSQPDVARACCSGDPPQLQEDGAAFLKSLLLQEVQASILATRSSSPVDLLSSFRAGVGLAFCAARPHIDDLLGSAESGDCVHESG